MRLKEFKVEEALPPEKPAVSFQEEPLQPPTAKATDASPASESKKLGASLEAAEAVLIRELRGVTSRILEEQEKTICKFTQHVLKACRESGVQGLDFSAYAASNREAPGTSTVEEEVEARLLGASPSEAASSQEAEEGALKSLQNRPSKLVDPPPAWQGANRGKTLHLPAVAVRWDVWWRSIEEPERKGRLADLTHSHHFEIATLLAIVLNGALVVYQTDAAAGLDAPLGEQSWDAVLDYCFTIYFLGELAIRLLVHRVYFFCNHDMGWNIFDASVILAALVDGLVTLLGNGQEQMDIALLRVLRVFRILRVLRALHVVPSLRQLVDCIVTSFSGLFWCMVLLLFLTGIFAVFLVQSATFFWQDEAAMDRLLQKHPEEAESIVWELKEAFGSVRVAMLSLLKASSGGEDWGHYQLLLSRTGWVAPGILIIYILFFMIAAWNIVTSLFVEKALALAQPDIETRMLMQKRQNMTDAADLMELIKAIDDDNSGTISISEFSKWVEEPRFKQFLEVKGVDIKDAELFFHMLEAAAHSNEVNINVAVNGLMRMRGIATNLDLQALNFTINSVYNTFDQHLKVVAKELKRVGKEVNLLGVRAELGNQGEWGWAESEESNARGLQKL